MNMNQALLESGVRDDTLSVEEKDFLDLNGYLPLGKILTPEQIANMIRRLDKLAELEGEDAGKELHQEGGTIRVSNLVNKGPMFQIGFSHPRVLAAIEHVIGPRFKLSSLDCRMALPGQGHQAFHADWRSGVEPGDYYVCNSMWLLDDFTEENGATRVVPGSHRSGKHPKDALEDATQHPEEIQLIAAAGTVIVFNSHLWHAGGLNQADSPRHGMLAYYCRRDHKQLTDQRKFIHPETHARLNEAQRFILAV
ncbi:phytanoyl-CoA dioxygenase family protein [Candidatus Poribacteria bacterium]|nr:phytanoyl-CoA dioxygenase family protein [Candidatus Poribacteria bacterium]